MRRHPFLVGLLIGPTLVITGTAAAVVADTIIAYRRAATPDKHKEIP